MGDFTKALKKLAVVAALGASGLAQAGTLNFEQPVDSTFFTGVQVTQFGNYWVETHDGRDNGGFAGALIDGADSGICSGGFSCPVNNKTNYYAGLDDGYFYFGDSGTTRMSVKSLRASFMGTPEAATGILVLQGYSSTDQLLGSIQLSLGGPNASGQYNFGTYSLGAFANISFDYVLVIGYGCPVGSTQCNRTSNLSNFAIDDIVTERVPEPASWALMGLGLMGLAAFTRRRAA